MTNEKNKFRVIDLGSERQQVLLEMVEELRAMVESGVVTELVIAWNANGEPGNLTYGPEDLMLVGLCHHAANSILNDAGDEDPDDEGIDS